MPVSARTLRTLGRHLPNGKRLSACIAAAGVLVAGTASAGPDSTIHSEDCEAALALSALPARLRDDATTYIWKNGDYRRAGTGDARFHCFVARNHTESVIPQCFTVSGVDNIMAGEIFKSRLVMEGAAPDDAVTAFEKKVENGEFVAPEEPGINYMMSAYNWIYQSARDEFVPVPPHVMFFAPNVEPEDVGSATFPEAVAQKGIPMVVESGIHAYMVTFTDGSSESDDVARHCAGEPLLEPLALCDRRRLYACGRRTYRDAPRSVNAGRTRGRHGP